MNLAKPTAPAAQPVPTLTRDELIVCSTLALARVATMSLNGAADRAYCTELHTLADKIDAIVQSMP